MNIKNRLLIIIRIMILLTVIIWCKTSISRQWKHYQRIIASTLNEKSMMSFNYVFHLLIGFKLIRSTKIHFIPKNVLMTLISLAKKTCHHSDRANDHIRIKHGNVGLRIKWWHIPRFDKRLDVSVISSVIPIKFEPLSRTKQKENLG